MLTKIQEKRLLNVARALREAAATKKKFNMEKYVFGDDSSLSTEYDYGKNCHVTQNEEANFCGTPACALGHYAARTDMQRILKVSILKNMDGVKYATMDFFGETAGSGWNDLKVCEHFGITSQEFFNLFDYDGCGGATTALQAAKFIEKFVKTKQRVSRSTTTR